MDYRNSMWGNKNLKLNKIRNQNNRNRYSFDCGKKTKNRDRYRQKRNSDYD